MQPVHTHQELEAGAEVLFDFHEAIQRQATNNDTFTIETVNAVTGSFSACLFFLRVD